MKHITLIATMAAALSFPTASNAVTVAFGSTRVGDIGGINAIGAPSDQSFIPGAYFGGATNPASDWVWSGDSDTTNSAIYEFNFHLSAYEATTASLSGLWGVDNTGTVSLNGNQIGALTNVVVENFSNLNVYGTSTEAFFQAGMNTLRFNLSDAGGIAGFRATVTVDATVPLPASAALMVLGIGGIAAVGRRRK